MLSIFKNLLALLDRKAKQDIPFLILAFVFLSFLDVIGVGLIGIFLGILTNNTSFQHLPLVHHFVGENYNRQLIIVFGLLLMVAFIVKSIITISIQKKIVVYCQSLAARLKYNLMAAYQYAPYIFHMQKDSSHLVSRIQSNIDQFVNFFLMPLLNLISSLTVVTFIMSFLLYMNPIPTLMLIGMFVLLGFSYDYYFKSKLSHSGKTVANINGEIIKNINQGLKGLVEIRVLGKEEYFLNKLQETSKSFASSFGTLVAFQQVPRYLVEAFIAIFLVVLSIVSLSLKMSAADIISLCGMFAAAGSRLLPTMNQIMSTINQIRGSYHNLDAIHNELLELNYYGYKAHINQSIDPTKKLEFNICRLIDVDFSYPNSDRLSLKNINLSIQKGQSIGLMGRSGAGKSTLINLILGFVKPEKGFILIDEHPLEDTRAWLNNFAYIPQTIFLMNDTLKQNIVFGMDDDNIDQAKLLKSIEMAQLNDVVKMLPQGVDTMVGENGIRLSGGQRQRIAIARALYHERDIIIMDEATSALDVETEAEVIQTIKFLKQNKTLIVISHRPSTIEHCDVIYQMDQGQLTQVEACHAGLISS